MVDGAETPSKQHLIADTPSKQRSILKNGHTIVVNGEGTPKSLRKVLFSTPAKAHELQEEVDVVVDSPLTAARNADRSARKKSARKLFRTDDEELDEEDDIGEDIAQEILGSENDQEDEDEDLDETVTITASASVTAPDTPSKQSKLRGRPKGKRRARSPTPPDNLPPHELYFFQNRPGGVKTSTNTLPSNALLDHDGYFAQIDAYKDQHEDDVTILTNMHKASFEQWELELEQGFNICLYGYGSKKPLVLDFADHLYTNNDNPTVVIVNGYNPSLTIKDVLTTLASTILSPSQVQKLPLQQNALLDAILSTLSSSSHHVHILIHSIDAPSLRKHQSIISTLASHAQISLLASADTLTFPLLWDMSLRTAFRFVFHDTTTYLPYTSELDPVEEVNTLLGRSGRRVGGKDGVAYVLRSLPENARNLYRILVAEQLALADASEGDTALQNGMADDSDEEMIGMEDSRFDMHIESMNDTAPSKRIRRGRPAKNKPATVVPKRQLPQLQGVEYRTLYHKAVEEFVCSSEMSFRTLLKEFHDHDMLESRKDALGVERLSTPFAREELEEILGELV